MNESLSEYFAKDFKARDSKDTCSFYVPPHRSYNIRYFIDETVNESNFQITPSKIGKPHAQAKNLQEKAP